MSALLLVAVLAAGVPVHVTPSTPTVGDPITIVFPDFSGATLRLESTDRYEIVSSEGNQAVIRSFRLKPRTLKLQPPRSFQVTEEAAFSSSLQLIPPAYPAAMMLPTLTPASRSTKTPYRSSSLKTPM